ncbi:hypothetical protein DFP72DRAFT_1094305 [Ephemerocybe angulata]|uniref:Uncharacterized protein n=1 Tax=Ephemerocybe angulata TaxID=980116 RepID=A0A8H6I9X9_9AGAR|nr:hypothetical protein DFP72DRAFT_1094305 [Tulosesus angulatus]
MSNDRPLSHPGRTAKISSMRCTAESRKARNAQISWARVGMDGGQALGAIADGGWNGSRRCIKAGRGAPSIPHLLTETFPSHPSHCSSLQLPLSPHDHSSERFLTLPHTLALDDDAGPSPSSSTLCDLLVTMLAFRKIPFLSRITTSATVERIESQKIPKSQLHFDTTHENIMNSTLSTTKEHLGTTDYPQGPPNAPHPSPSSIHLLKGSQARRSEARILGAAHVGLKGLVYDGTTPSALPPASPAALPLRRSPSMRIAVYESLSMLGARRRVSRAALIDAKTVVLLVSRPLLCLRSSLHRRVPLAISAWCGVLSNGGSLCRAYKGLLWDGLLKLSHPLSDLGAAARCALRGYVVNHASDLAFREKDPVASNGASGRRDRGLCLSPVAPPSSFSTPKSFTDPGVLPRPASGNPVFQYIRKPSPQSAPPPHPH